MANAEVTTAPWYETRDEGQVGTFVRTDAECRFAATLPRSTAAGQALFARTGRDGQRDATMFWAAAAARPGSDSSAVEAGLVEEVEKLAAEPIGGEEMDRARRQLEVAILLGRQSAEDRGRALGIAHMIEGDWRHADRHLERLRSLTPADVQQAAARTFAAMSRYARWLDRKPGRAVTYPVDRTAAARAVIADHQMHEHTVAAFRVQRRFTQGIIVRHGHEGLGDLPG